MSALQAAEQNLQPLLPETLNELEWWRRQERQATLWWRDDDAMADSPALRQMLEISARNRFPLTLAVIPHGLENNLVSATEDCPDLSVMQHGYRHLNHSPADQKKCELGDNRNPVEVLTELTAGRKILSDAFADRFVPALAPPWNRIGSIIATRLDEAGLTGLSLYGDKPASVTDVITGRHTHLDIIDWKGSRGFTGATAVDRLFATALRQRREGKVEITAPIGLLTHHLVHDPAAWDFLNAFAAFARHNPALICKSGTEVFAWIT
tara:strand:+ start:1941 stop:2738 length:798 start_codon:yes stop_codon:yes gene_type:complete